MADNSAVTTLVFDASGAKKGAADFQASGQQRDPSCHRRQLPRRR
jgi:hypothetical protein